MPDRSLPGNRGASFDALLVSIVQSTDDAVIAKDTDAKIISWNPGAEKIYGYTAEEVIGKDVSILVPKEREGEERTILGQILDGKPVDHYETQRVRRDGQLITVSLTVSPLPDVDGNIIGASVIARDISDLKRALELEQANENFKALDALKSQFLAMASHELRTPLTAISGFVETLQTLGDQLSVDDRTNFLTIIGQQTNRLERMVEHLLTLSRVEAGVLKVRPRPVSVPVAIEQAVRDLQASEVAVNCPDDIVALADADHLQQILINYVGNALKYGAAPISIVADRTNRNVEIVVTDHGPGVPKEFVPHLFETFSRGEADSQKVGTGLGLSIVRALVEAQGGEAFYEANRPSGARFGVRLPRVV
jgi:PAS domain S-box-containing protein